MGYRWSGHAAAVDYAEGVDQAVLPDEAEMAGVAYVYSPVGWVQLYAMWKRHVLERPAESFQAIHFYMVGTRLVF